MQLGGILERKSIMETKLGIPLRQAEQKGKTFRIVWPEQDRGRRVSIAAENVVAFREREGHIELKTLHGYYYIKSTYETVNRWITKEE